MNAKIKKDFPIFKQKINGHPIIYLDSASTSQKPQAVLDAVNNFYTTSNANVHRGVYTLAEQATQMYEDARATVAKFLNADPNEIVFTGGTTESINLVANTWGIIDVEPDDEIVITELEHHSNLLPWQLLAYHQDATLKYIPVRADGRLDLSKLSSIFTDQTRLVSVSHVSNALGSHNGVAEIIEAAHNIGALVVVDAAQSAPHQAIDVRKMECDFLAFSGHKLLAPTGVGVLFVNKAMHEVMPPYQVGGGMVYEAAYKEASWRDMPYKLEAGTPPIAQAIGLAAGIKYLQETVDFAELKKHEAALCEQLIDGLSELSSIRILGPVDELKKTGHLVSFVVDGMHAHDVAAYLDKFGICVRAGHQCAQPLAKKMGLDASVRVSFYLYNDAQEVEQFLAVMRELHKGL